MHCKMSSENVSKTDIRLAFLNIYFRVRAKIKHLLYTDKSASNSCYGTSMYSPKYIVVLNKTKRTLIV